MEIPAASISQFVRTRDGQRVLVDDDVNNVARDLRKVDQGLRLHWSEVTGLFAVVFHTPDGGEQLVFTAPECDQRIVRRVEQLTSPDYDFGSELDRLDQLARKRNDDELRDRIGDASERLAHAIREDLRKARPGPVYVPPDVY